MSGNWGKRQVVQNDSEEGIKSSEVEEQVFLLAGQLGSHWEVECTGGVTTYRRTGSYLDVPGDRDSFQTTTAVTDDHEKPKAEERYFTGKIKLDEIAERNDKHPDLPDEERHGPCPNNEHCIVDEWTDRDSKGGSGVKDEPGPYDHVSKWEVRKYIYNWFRIT
ncbi:hypothetical protein TNCT_284941 [Trichonephila clavata]|uniref:Uncharacterized protein n=1 Tax=Trichonephila clavata TaxID=2740835 RepID=A0A8X6FNR6_TRICU|nr:hypothetical protein TNCT_284941 [Trichonephila clavata]